MGIGPRTCHGKIAFLLHLCSWCSSFGAGRGFIPLVPLSLAWIGMNLQEIGMNLNESKGDSVDGPAIIPIPCILPAV